MMMRKPFLLRSVLLFAAVALVAAAPSHADGYAENRDKSVGVEVNILWPFPPFRTYEVKLRGKLGYGVEAVVGYGRQAWTYKGERHNRGTMDSHALLVGARTALFGTNANLEYTAWLCKDRFAHENGRTYAGYSYANEFYVGYAYYFPGTPAYVLPQWNWGFWSWKSYEMPLDDLYVFDFLPKVSVGYEF
jgi:hypothetical protein